MRAAALELGALGWRVFPVAEDGRSPRIKGGCHAASSDPEQVARWRDGNFALACGPESGVIALDIDRKGDIDGVTALQALCAEFGPLPRTVRSRTPSGGAHLLFRHPEGVTIPNRVGLKRYAPDGSRTIYRGLDVRAAGGSICLPPSRTPRGSYEWVRSPWDADLAALPDWLLCLMTAEPPPRPVRPLRITGSTDRVARYVCNAVNGECSELAAMSPGSGRNTRLFIAAARLGELVGAGLLLQDDAEAALERAAADCGLVKEDGLRAVRLTIASGLRRGIQNPRELAA